MNAAVEAARAGKHGTGFNVIAEEVKRLAQISKDAAEEINQITATNLNEAKLVNKYVDDILDPIEKTSVLVNHIYKSSEEQETGTNKVSQSIYQLYNISKENASTSQEMAANATELEEHATSLKEMVSYFKIDQNKLTNLELNNDKKKLKKVVKQWKKQQKTLHKSA